MPSSAKSAFGTKLYRGGSGTPKTGGTLIEELTSIDPPEASDVDVDATSQDSASVSEDINSGCVDGGEITIEGNYTAAAGQELLRGDAGGAAQGYYINLAGGSGQKQLDFSANVKNFKLNLALRDAIRFSAKLRITGAVTWTNQG